MRKKIRTLKLIRFKENEMKHIFIKNKRSKRIHIKYPDASNDISLCRKMDIGIIETTEEEFKSNSCIMCKKLLFWLK